MNVHDTHVPSLEARGAKMTRKMRLTRVGINNFS